MSSTGRTDQRTNILIGLSVLFAATIAFLAIIGSNAVGIVAGVGGVLFAGAWLLVGGKDKDD